MSEVKKGLELLREKFPSHLVSQKPQGTKAQNECPANEKVNCKICGGWHHPRVQHLAYVGHAALTDRLLDADPNWNWEPLAFEDGLPKFDATGGLWIKLTVCGVTRLGYGHAQQTNFKEIGAREKEVIGDALRNAAMRFGAALDLWSKADLHGDDEKTESPNNRVTENTVEHAPVEDNRFQSELLTWQAKIEETTSRADLDSTWLLIPVKYQPSLKRIAKRQSEKFKQAA